MVISWILGALFKQIGRSVIYSNSAHEMWRELEEWYGTSSVAQLFGLHKDLSEINLGNNNIAEYFIKMKMLWDDIDALCFVPICTCGCKCGAAKKMAKFQQNQRVIQFRTGLNESYNAMRGSILMSSPLPSLGQVYNILLQEEAQRNIHCSGHFMEDAASLNARVNSSQFKPKTLTDKPKSTLHCNYFKKSGHLIDKCYRLHGFPNGFKFNKPGNFAAHMDSPGSFSDVV